MTQFGPGMSLEQMPPFIPGMQLCRQFYHEAVRPIVDRRFGDLPHAAGLLDYGSDVLGFDTPVSRDHGWGPRCTLFLREQDHDNTQDVAAVLGQELPFEICGYPTNFNNWCMLPTTRRPIRHLVQITTAQRFFVEYVGVDGTRPIDDSAWLSLPAQRLRTVQSGEVFHDGLGELTEARRRLAWYPHDVWLYLLACQWRRIDQEEPFMARCGDAGDELGSRLMATRQVQDIMRLCFLMERVYPPYAKWFSTAFSRLRCADKIAPSLRRALEVSTWQERESALLAASVAAANIHNGLGITEPLDTQATSFHGRPYRIVGAGRFVVAIRAKIQSQVVRRFPEHLGAVWQFADSTDVLDRLDRCSALAGAAGTRTV